jgi:hypothetical protein
VVAAITVGRSDDLSVAARLLQQRTDVSGLRGRLEDVDEEITELG